MNDLTMVVLAPFYVMAVAGTATGIAILLMYLIDAVRKQLQKD